MAASLRKLAVEARVPEGAAPEEAAKNDKEKEAVQQMIQKLKENAMPPQTSTSPPRMSKTKTACGQNQNNRTTNTQKTSNHR